MKITISLLTKYLKTVILAILVSMTFFSCQEEVKVEELRVVDAYSRARLFGFNEAKYLLGRTQKQYVTPADIGDFENRGMKVKFADNNILKWVEIVSPNFTISSRIKVGDKRDKLVDFLGEPKSEKAHVGKQNQKLGEIKALYYDNLIFYTRDNVISIIIFGNTLHSDAHGLHQKNHSKTASPSN